MFQIGQALFSGLDTASEKSAERTLLGLKDSLSSKMSYKRFWRTAVYFCNTKALIIHFRLTKKSIK